MPDQEAAPPESPAALGLAVEHLECTLDVTYNWGYEETRHDLRELYRKAVHAQWTSEETLPWHLPVDRTASPLPDFIHPLFGSDLHARMTPAERSRSDREVWAWMLSQFLHGEQGALLAAAQLCTAVPDIDSKFYASSQVMDEGRHVEVYDRYLREKVGLRYPISPYLKQLLDLILKDSRWDMKFLGMQIMVEGLALAAFGMIRQFSDEPLIRRLTHFVMVDEARHVAYGVLSLRDFYQGVSEKERLEREDFVYEAAVLMRDRFLFQQVWENLGMPVAECVAVAEHSEAQRLFRQSLFSRIVPAIKRVGLLSPRQRERFEALGILGYEASDEPLEVYLGEPPPLAPAG